MNSAGMAAAMEMLPKAPVEEYTQFAIKADKVVKRMVSIVPPPKDGLPLSTAIESSTVGRLVGTSESPVCIHYDIKLSGEASSKPATRAPPHNEDHLKKVLGAMLSSRPDPTCITPGDQYAFMDAGKPGLEPQFMSFSSPGAIS